MINNQKKITPKNVSVVVITKDRVSLLARLINSIKNMTKLPGEVIIISSSKDLDQEKKLLNGWMKLIYEPPTGYAAARNRGIKESKGQVIAFVDDDCTVPKEWISQIVAAQNRYRSGVVMGAVKSRPIDNFWAQVAQLHYDNWVKTVCNGDVCTTVDAKATSFDRKLMIEQGFWFKEELAQGSEDIEWGHRLYQSGIKLIYEPKIFFYHHERINLIQVLKQRWRIAKSEVRVSQFVKNLDVVDMLPPTKLSRLIPRATKKLGIWIKNNRLSWCVMYVCFLPVMFGVRVVGYWWGSRK